MIGSPGACRPYYTLDFFGYAMYRRFIWNRIGIATIFGFYPVRYNIVAKRLRIGEICGSCVELHVSNWNSLLLFITLHCV